MYAIFDGTHYNGGCCFDYGNAETNSRDNGNGTMEAIYFGNIKVWGYGTGNGPWVMADLENGLFSGVNAGYNANDPTVNNRFLTAIVKGEPNQWAIRGGNAQSGALSTYYNGARPNVSGYNPMKKEGAIILGIGGDNSNGSAGTFYEGVMTSGYPTDATENAVQANIVAAGYAHDDGVHPVHAGRPCLGAGHDRVLHRRLPPAQRGRQQRDHRAGDVGQLGHRQGRRDLDRASRTGNSSCISFESANAVG